MKKFNEWLIENNDIVDKIRDALKEVRRDSQGDALQVWYNPAKHKAFISVGDWVESGDWAKAVEKVVGKGNVKGESEVGHPGGDGWIRVRDYQRIADRTGIDEERKKVLGL